MAEKSKTEEKKEKNKILIVIGVLAVAVFVLVFISYTKQQNNLQNKGNGESVQVTNTPQDSEVSLSSQKWTWVSTQMNDGSETLPSTTGAFTLTFQDDGRVVATTDCNGGNGSYELGPDNAITIGPMATTMMFCESSTDSKFYQDLNNVGSYMIGEDGGLVLMIKFDSGSMIFE